MPNIPRPPLDTLSRNKTILPPEAEKELARIYHEQPNEDFNSLRKKASRQRWFLILTTTLLILLTAGAVWYFIFGSSGAKFGEEAVAVKLTGPATIPSGQVSEYVLSWRNDQSVDLVTSEVDFRLPDGVTVQNSSRPALDEAKTKFDLGTIKAQGVGELKIELQLIGEVGQDKEIGALFTYEPSNFKAQFVKTASTITQLVESVITVDLQTPTQLPTDQTLNLKLSYNNTSTNKLSNLALKFIAPIGFQLNLPALETIPGQDNLWKLPDLEAKNKNDLELAGKFTEAAQIGDQEFSVIIGVWDGNNLTVQQEKRFIITLIESHLTLNLTVNQVALISYGDWGEQLDFALHFANEGAVTLTDVVLRAKLDQRLLDWVTWQTDTPGQVDQARGEIQWTRNDLPQLASLEPGAKSNITFRLKIVSVEPAGGVAPYGFESKVEAEATQAVGDNQQKLKTSSNVVTTKINTQLMLEAEGRYYTDQLVKIGSGPLPPKVNETTTYVVYWRLLDTINDVNNIEVTTTLPADVVWTGQSNVKAGQQVTYNPNTREVRWQLNKLPAGAGFKFEKPEASFEVAITPTDQDADKILVLVKSSTVTGKDAYSGADLLATAKMITTELDDDLGAQGKGVVVR